MAPKRKARVDISLDKELMQCSELENAFKKKWNAGRGEVTKKLEGKRKL
jgi:hypothetical protein